MNSANHFQNQEDFENNPFASQVPANDSEQESGGLEDQIPDDNAERHAYKGIENSSVIEPEGSMKCADSSNGEVANDVAKGITDPLEKYKDPNLIPERLPKKKYDLVIKVLSIERIGTFTSKKENPNIIMDVSTNLPTFRRKTFKKIRKTMNELRQLHKFLRHTIIESFVPAVPASYTSFGISNNHDYDQMLENIQNWFNRICKDPLIIRSEEIAFFFESDYSTYTPIGKAKQPVSGIMRKTLKQLAPPFDEVTDLAEFRPLVKSIYQRCQMIHEKMGKMNKLRKHMMQEQATFGKQFSELDNSNKLYTKFGKILTTMGDIESIMVTMDMATLDDYLGLISNDAYSVKEALTNRHLVMRELVQAQQQTKYKQEQARKMRSRRDVSPLKIDEALMQLKEATQVEQSLTTRLRRITANMLTERQEWLLWYEATISESLKRYTLRQIEYERKKLALLERIRVDVRRADSRGGLSRLGRDSLKWRDLESSQNMAGDSWTGDQRHYTQDELDRFTHTEFDNLLNQEEGTGEVDTVPTEDAEPTELVEPDENSLLVDARNAAMMLGQTTF